MAIIHSKPKKHIARWQETGWGGAKFGQKLYIIYRCSFPGCNEVKRKTIK